MTRLIRLPLVFLAAACSPVAEGPATVQVADAVCRPAAAGRDVTGCYVTLTAGREDRLVSAASPSARAVEIHEMKTENGLMRMSELADGLPLAAGETTRLAPGGEHLMVLGVTDSLAEGGSLLMTLTFQHAPAQEVSFRIGQPVPARP